MCVLYLGAMLSSCDFVHKEALSLKDFNSEVDRTTNLLFHFNQNIVNENKVGKKDSTPYVLFEPTIEGYFRWDSPSKLSFVPKNVLPPATRYKATLNERIIDNTKFKLPSPNVVDFNTPLLKIKNSTVYWKQASKNEAYPVIGASLTFNYKLKPNELTKNLKVFLNNKATNYEMLTAEMGSAFKIEVPTSEINDEIAVRFDINEGLFIANSSATLHEKLSSKHSLPAPNEVGVSGIEANHDGFSGHIEVATTQQVLKENLKNLISITPKVNFEVEYHAAGFTISSSEFDAAKPYKLTIAKGLKGIFRGELEEDYKGDVAFGKVEPSLAFVNNNSMYLSNKAYKNIGIKIVNVPKVKVRVSKVFANNIMAFLQDRMRYGSQYINYGNDYQYYSYQYYDSEKYGKLVSEEVYEVSELERVGNVYLLQLDFNDRLKDRDGVYVMEIQDADRRYIAASKIVSYSDIGLMAKQEKDALYVFAHAISTAEPIAGAKISFVSKTNQLMKIITTNQEGVAVFSNIKNETPDFIAEMLTAQKGNDFNFMLLNKTKINAAKFETGGLRLSDAGYQAFMYGDRNLYRPGETVFLSTIIRTNSWKNPGEIPVKIALLQPNGKVYKTLRKTLDNQGATETSFDIPNGAVTGTYTAEVYTANDILLNSYHVSVEEFMPDRIKVKLKTDKNSLGVNDSIVLTGTVLNLFGPPASNRNYAVEVSLKRKGFHPKNYPDYTFSITNNKSFGSVLNEGKTDTQGLFVESYMVPSAYADAGVLQGKFYTTVFDESGRPVNRVAPFEVFTQKAFYGIGAFPYYMSTNKTVDIPLVAVDKEGQTISDEADLKIIRYQWRTVLESTRQGRYRYKSQRDEIVEVNKKVQLKDDNMVYSYIPSQSGQFEVRISKPGVSSYVTRSFYAYRYGDTESTSFEVNQEGEISMEFDKPTYKVGETATVLLKAPFEGRMLVAIEREEVISYQFAQTDKKVKSLQFAITKDMMPNVYLTATLIRPSKELNVPLTVAHGFAPMMVEDAANGVAVKVTAEDKSRSKTKQLITVETIPNANVTIAVVDEGILQIKNYDTPNPYNFFYQKRALEVASYDLYPYLFPEMVPSSMITGGDADMGKRVNPVPNKRVKLVSYWSGIKNSGASGKVSYEIDIPQFSGDLRVMAVAYKDKQFGSNDQSMKVADPLVVSAGLPRFFSPNDTITMPLTLTNTTKNADKARINITTEGPVTVLDGNNKTTDLSADGENRTFFKVVANNSIGPAKIKVDVETLGETFKHETDITVRPPASLQKRSSAGAVKAGDGLDLDLLNKDFVPESVDGQLVISKNPALEFADDLDYLVGYPHGCVEQTVSKAFPQIYFSDMVTIMGKNRRTATMANSNNPNWNVQQAVNKLEGMQLGSGGLSYWQGGRYESWWGSVFTCHFLIEAKKAGFEVNENVLDKLFTYVQRKLKKKETFAYFYYDENNKEQKREIARKEIPYSLYVLALAGKADASTMNYYKANVNNLAADGRYLLAGAYALAGDVQKFNEILPTDFIGDRSKKVFGGSFYSPIRDRAIALNALVEVDPNNQQIATLTKHLIDDYKKSKWLNTQERVFTFLAIGKMAKKSAGTNVTATVQANGKTVATFDGENISLSYADINTDLVRIMTKGSEGSVYYFWNVEGLTADGSYVQEDSYLKIRRSFFDRYGRPIDNNTVTQNDIVVVKLSLLSTGSDNVENVVVTDILPAGLEVENPRIGELPNMDWIKNESKPEHQDFRDDRVHFFTYATNKNKDFYYLTRAVTPGQFQLGPVSADAMYDGEYHSYHGAGVFNVVMK